MTIREFTNELGNRIKITIEGPTSTSENILTGLEARHLNDALSEVCIRSLDAAPAAGVKALLDRLQQLLDEATWNGVECDGDEERAEADDIMEKLSAFTTPSSPDVELQAEVERLTKALDKVLATSAAYNATEREGRAIMDEAAAIARAEAAEARASSAEQEEREACAQVAETIPDEPYAKHGQWHGTLRKTIAAAIRARTTLRGAAE